MEPLQVRQVRDALERKFRSLIDCRDIRRESATMQEQKFRTRAFAALTVQMLTRCTDEEAAASVIDHFGDNGIDAVAVTEPAGELAPRLWLIQTKWSDEGKGTIKLETVRALVEGLDFIDNHQYDRFNGKFQPHAEQVKATCADNCNITLVVAVMGRGQLSPDTKQRLDDARSRFNTLGEVLDYRVVDAAAVHQFVRDEFAEPPVSITAKMVDWIHIADPYEAYYGTVPTEEIASWYADHGERLFGQNIRSSLGVTQVNRDMDSTLTERSPDFWYFNNGITILCHGLRAVPWSRGSGRGPIALDLDKVSVVNGAQTVTAVHAAVQRSPSGARGGYVGVRVINVANCPDGFASEITRATNTQNHVVPQDFVALRPEQMRIREDFTISLGKTYSLKRGEQLPEPADGCTLVQAGIALACAYRDPRIAMQAKQNVDQLWDTERGGTYHQLFGYGPVDRPNVYRIWRTVRFYRAVVQMLAAERKKLDGRGAGLTDVGDFLVAHVLFQHLADESIDEPDAAEEWKKIIDKKVPEAVPRALALLIRAVDDTYGPRVLITNIFKQHERWRELADIVGSALASRTTAPEIPVDYRAKRKARSRRKPNAVSTLLNAKRIPDGTMLRYRHASGTEQTAISGWLKEDPQRDTATWVNARSNQLLWTADGKRYSPSGLVTHMWSLAEWVGAPVANQGTVRWEVPGEGTLAELADKILLDTSGEDDLFD